VPGVRARVPGRRGRHPVTERTDQLWEGVVYIAYHLHWSFDSIIDLDHFSRAKVINEIDNLNLVTRQGWQD
jgi:hypothetical protein